jgi:Prolyl oligopeptidase family
MILRNWIGILSITICSTYGFTENEGFSVRDSIEMNTFSEPNGMIPDAVAQTSPDGKYFVAVTSRGLIEANQVESSIWLFDSAAVRAFLQRKGTVALPPPPRLLARRSAASIAEAISYMYNPVISDLHWTRDSDSLYFLTQDSSGVHRLCRVKIRTGLVETLSPLSNDVERYSVLNHGVVYTSTRGISAKRAREDLPGDPINANASAVTGLSMSSILFPSQDGLPTPQFRELWMSRGGQFHKVEGASFKLTGVNLAKDADVLSTSPNERYVIRLQPVLNVPPSWQAYVPLPGYEDWHANLTSKSPANYYRPWQYALIDLESGRSQPLLDAPFGETLAYFEANQAVWSRSGNRILLSNSFLPLEGVDASERAKRVHPCAVAVVETPSRQVHCIVYSRNAANITAEVPEPLVLEAASFGPTDDEMVVHLRWLSGKQRWQTERYQYSNQGWKLESTSADDSDKSKAEPVAVGHPNSVSVRIKQSMNVAPALWATDASSGQSKEIWNPNPQFAKMKFGVASVFHWKDQTGYEWTGGLVKPVDYVPGRRYPLVIQTHGFLDYNFMTDGYYPTAGAARPLASSGIVVLQIATNPHHHGELPEAHLQGLGYAAAIDQLASDGLVDPKRVGIIGFSRTCWYVETALIEDPERFAAASITDGTDESYMTTMIFHVGIPSESERMYGAKPFGEGLERWLALAPGFHLDKVEAPLLITAIKPKAIPEEWEIYSSLYQQKKPVELVYIPKGQHILQQPLDRLASQQGNVDWFRFWLQGYERENVEDSSQYSRWRKLRDLQVGRDPESHRAHDSPFRAKE